ncbi:unnamed protein product [Cyprideis torosa]|uniref:Uncharacterized protein n=1 Tax=Cyprideis torosa TaxID=163714 RepID=A0A7R8ZJD0_9CRUS|nr:unnamed protein product [Cyprideis torosa]CAG0888333.1 unnamed protein product [Cyprideis torosa]
MSSRYSSLSDKVELFAKKAEAHEKTQLANPFSSWQGAGQRKTLDRNDPEYGRPVLGSKTDRRGKAANTHVNREVVFLCDMIYEHGTQEPDGFAYITFGELFNLYIAISNKVVGVLLRARKKGWVDFPGEMLYQRRDDDVLIRLAKPISEIHQEA